MPELPFIAVLVENLGRRVVGRSITTVRMKSPSILKTYDPPIAAAEGRQIHAVRRLGKLILLDLSGDLLMAVHLMRHGRLQVVPAHQRSTKDLALVLGLDDGQDIRVIELGPKKQAAVYLLRSGEEAAGPPLAGLGVDPFADTFSPDDLRHMLESEKGQVKRFLTVQRHLAGIGNAFSDEILWEARLSPFAPAARLSEDEVARLHHAIREVLARALQEHREYFGEALPMSEPPALLRVHRNGGEACRRCGTRIEVVYFADRETYYCPMCQTGGKVYADRRLSRLRR